MGSSAVGGTLVGYGAAYARTPRLAYGFSDSGPPDGREAMNFKGIDLMGQLEVRPLNLTQLVYGALSRPIYIFGGPSAGRNG